MPLLMPQWVQVTEYAEFSSRNTAEGVIFRDCMWISNVYYKWRAVLP